ncbi:pirin family protein [Arthrobacter mobilis]|uniref:Pirin family protein n=1 Tax=Arthrobacter mobilis TaxID=2724944 RepID=A0A7X6HEG4_9MICC|nr:pirin family protein [Arthrobacter mobilis]NKX55633.1 pirin family protein [Arthrobacter mobilis]
MSNLESNPRELTCTGTAGVLTRPAVQVLAPREVPLGGLRAMPVRRTLPQRERSLIGPWCFLDHYGPDDVRATGGMRLPPHPHTGLQTVSWLFSGEIEHRDSAGYHALVRPGQLNLMTAGRGISHSEVSTAATSVLHGAQLWLALPDRERFTDPGFEHYAPPAVAGEGFELRVFIGSLAGSSSPVRTFSPVLGAEVLVDAGATVPLAVDPAFEHGVLVDAGSPAVNGQPVARAELAYLPPGGQELVLAAGDEPVRVLLLGGQPLGETIVMWWNFVGRSHEEVVQYRANWQAQIGAEPPGPPLPAAQSQFGTVTGNTMDPLPAPALPNARLRPRG